MIYLLQHTGSKLILQYASLRHGSGATWNKQVYIPCRSWFLLARDWNMRNVTVVVLRMSKSMRFSNYLNCLSAFANTFLGDSWLSGFAVWLVDCLVIWMFVALVKWLASPACWLNSLLWFDISSGWAKLLLGLISSVRKCAWCCSDVL